MNFASKNIKELSWCIILKKEMIYTQTISKNIKEHTYAAWWYQGL